MFLLGLFVFLCPSWAQGDEKVYITTDGVHYCADTVRLRVFFERNSSRVEPGFRDNAVHLQAFRTALGNCLTNPEAVIRSILIRTTSSPEGGIRLNERLSESRAENLDAYLRDSVGLDPSLFRIHAAGEDWEGLTEAVRKLDMPWRADVLEILEKRDAPDRKRRLMTLQGGKVWRWLDANVFPDLRSAGGSVSCIVYRPVKPQADTVYIRETVKDTVVVAAPLPVTGQAYEDYARSKRDYNLQGKRMIFAVRTNVLGIPLANVGVEVPLGERWSVGADWYYPWLWRPRHGEGLDYAGRCFELLAGDLEARYWFPRKSKKPEQRLLGHSVGVYAAGGYYDFERNWTGHQGWFYNIGVDYLFGMPIFRGRMHLEFELGIGYIYSPAQPYDTFVAGDKAFRRKGVTQYTRWFGPTRAQISLVWPIYVNAKKGGER